ncbi:myoneurin-like [Drosophila innubila]|uniref:myoneurin-like n=1 Tax=Drosophila innubila TaxID=198719 RepID=UPI00148BBFBC|nr:myoneurin-like [Drosophila innubila]XP_034484273.1 myoneurin-like [Drosophila innubila]
MYPICRVCMTSSGVLVDIFTKEKETFPSLEFMINECVEVKVTRNDNFPKHICKICLCDVHAAFRFKRNYELTLKQFNKKLDIKESKREDLLELSDQENNTEDVITSKPKTTTTIKRKKAVAFKTRRKVLITAKKKKKPKKKESECANEENLTEECKHEESQNEASPDLEETSDKSEITKSEPENEPSDLSHSESPSVDEDQPKAKRKRLILKPKKLYVCNICDKVLKSNSHLTMHALVHTGERPFKCECCLKNFRYKWNLKRHVDKNIDCQDPNNKKKVKKS